MVSNFNNKLFEVKWHEGDMRVSIKEKNQKREFISRVYR